ncbi:hypothetical protein GCM10010512_34010 [Streptomyces thermoviolaceus subsp. thermoviolaceus]|nr:hypothetical protein GCM10010512_34010 [Streptomyces thermoviolaceus subsp. thermoviolaceus]
MAARAAAIATPRASRSWPGRLSALAAGAATVPAISVAATSAPAEPSAMIRLFGLLCLKWALPAHGSMSVRGSFRL